MSSSPPDVQGRWVSDDLPNPQAGHDGLLHRRWKMVDATGFDKVNKETVCSHGAVKMLNGVLPEQLGEVPMFRHIPQDSRPSVAMFYEYEYERDARCLQACSVLKICQLFIGAMNCFSALVLIRWRKFGIVRGSRLLPSRSMSLQCWH